MLERIRKPFFFIVFIAAIVALPLVWKSSDTTKQEQKKSGLVIINVLSKALHDDCHITGSIQVDLPQLETFAEQSIDKKTDVVFYCSNYRCSASGFARKKLKELGFENVYVYEGGMAEWYQKGYPYTGKAESAYLKKVLEAPVGERESYELTAEQLREKIEMNKAA